MDAGGTDLWVGLLSHQGHHISYFLSLSSGDGDLLSSHSVYSLGKAPCDSEMASVFIMVAIVEKYHD